MTKLESFVWGFSVISVVLAAVSVGCADIHNFWISALFATLLAILFFIRCFFSCFCVTEIVPKLFPATAAAVIGILAAYMIYALTTPEIDAIKQDKDECLCGESMCNIVLTLIPVSTVGLVFACLLFCYIIFWT